MNLASPGPADVLSDADYQARARALLGAIESQIDRWLQDDVVDIDGARTGGLLELSLPGGSKIVVNTQPPLQEIWLAARSGGFHYRQVGGRWLDTKCGEEFFNVLSRCASEQAGKELRFEVPTT
jgi:CyaY protein